MNNFLKFNNKLEEFYNIDYNFHIFLFFLFHFNNLHTSKFPPCYSPASLSAQTSDCTRVTSL